MGLIPQRISTFLGQHGVSYNALYHRADATALQTAANTHTPAAQFAKTVVLSSDGRYLMAILPAHHFVDLVALRRALGAHTLTLATEDELEVLYPECEPGAMPPFGALYHLPAYVSAALAEQDIITFNAGTHDEAICMAYRDFARLVQPHILSFSALHSP